MNKKGFGHFFSDIYSGGFRECPENKPENLNQKREKIARMEWVKQKMLCSQDGMG